MQLRSSCILARPTAASRRAAEARCSLRGPSGRCHVPRRLPQQAKKYALVSKLDMLQSSLQAEPRSIEYWGVEELLHEPLSPRDDRRLQAAMPQNILHFAAAGHDIKQQQQQQELENSTARSDALELANSIAEQLASLAQSADSSLAASSSSDASLLQCLQQLASSCDALAQKQQHLVRMLSGQSHAGANPFHGSHTAVVAPAASADALTTVQAQLKSLVIELPATCTDAADSVSDLIASSTKRPIVGVPVAAPTLALPHTVGNVHMGSALVKGRKHAVMEDRHALATFDLASGLAQSHRGKPGCLSRDEHHVTMGAVFDGHGGWLTADHAAVFLPDLVCAGLTGRGRHASAGGPVLTGAGLLSSSDALEGALTCFDHWWARSSETMEHTANLGYDTSGCTAVMALVQGRQLTVANVGDSVAVLARGGAAHRLTVNHTALHAEEVARVVAAGGRVGPAKPGSVHRVWRAQQYCNQGLMVTRSLGDFGFKRPQQLIIPTPHLLQEQLTREDTLLLLTSDGVTDALSDAAMVEVAMQALQQAQQETEDGKQLAQAAAAAVVRAAREAGSTDDITAVAMVMGWA